MIHLYMQVWPFHMSNRLIVIWLSMDLIFCVYMAVCVKKKQYWFAWATTADWIALGHAELCSLSLVHGQIEGRFLCAWSQSVFIQAQKSTLRKALNSRFGWNSALYCFPTKTWLFFKRPSYNCRTFSFHVSSDCCPFPAKVTLDLPWRCWRQRFYH